MPLANCSEVTKIPSYLCGPRPIFTLSYLQKRKEENYGTDPRYASPVRVCALKRCEIRHQNERTEME